MKRVAGVVLAGGRSSRMGREKPLLEIGGKLLIERVVDAVSPCVAETILVTNRPELYRFLGLPVIPDAYPDRGPIAGILAGLRHLPGDAALVVACDYPFLDPVFLGRIAREDPAKGVVVPLIEGRLQPLCALYAAEVEPAVEESIKAGELMVLSLLSRLPQRVLTQDQLGGAGAARAFFNVNTPDDLRHAEALLAETQPPKAQPPTPYPLG